MPRSTKTLSAWRTSAPPMRCFTLARANRALVLVKRIAADLVAAHARLHEWQETLESAQSAEMVDLAARTGDRMRADRRKARQCVLELQDVGVEVEDAEFGLIDFPARVRGKEIRLCWRWGEPAVTHWHETGDTVADRRELDALG